MIGDDRRSNIKYSGPIEGNGRKLLTGEVVLTRERLSNGIQRGMRMVAQ